MRRCFEPNEVVIEDVLAIECDRSTITLNSLDPRKDYPKPKPVEKTVEVQISGEGRVTRISSLLRKE